MKKSLIVVSVFTVAACLWLALMENVLKHDGYVGRTLVHVLLAAEGVCALLSAVLVLGTLPRYILLLAGAVVCWCGASAVIGIMRAPHFEGFVLLVGSALLVQGVFTIVTLAKARPVLPRL